MVVATMRKEYDFSSSQKNPYADQLKPRTPLPVDARQELSGKQTVETADGKPNEFLTKAEKADSSYNKDMKQLRSKKPDQNGPAKPS